MVGRFLSYNVLLDVDGTLWLWVSSADDADLPQRVLSSVAAADWKIVARTISALEFTQVASVANRPFEIVDRFGERWVIA
jgi:hypothetical protein